MLRLIGKISFLISFIGLVVATVIAYPYVKWPDVEEEELEAFATECKDIVMELDGRSKDDLRDLKIITDDMQAMLDIYEILGKDQWPPFDYKKDEKWDEHYALITKHDEALEKLTEDGFVFQHDVFDLYNSDGDDLPELRPVRKLLIWQMAAASFEINQGQKDKALARLEAMMTIARGLMGSTSMLPLMFGLTGASKADKAIVLMVPHLDSTDLKKLGEWREAYPDPVDVFIQAFQYEVHYATSIFDLGAQRLVGSIVKGVDYQVAYAILEWLRWPQREKAVYLSAAKKQIDYFKAWDESGQKGDPVYIDLDVDMPDSFIVPIIWMYVDNLFANVIRYEKRTQAMNTVLGWFASSEDIQAVERREVEYDNYNLIVVENGKVWMEKKEKSGIF
jgi:hypothetical protein